MGMAETLAHSLIRCESHAHEEYRKLFSTSELSMTRLSTLGAYALKRLSPDELLMLHRTVKNTKRPNGRPPKR